jgi:hypothetical protein
MVTSHDEITRRLDEKDTARSARRAETATTLGDLARRHAELAGQLAELERELGELLSAAGDVIDVPELADVTDIPAADLTRWRDHAAKPARRSTRTRTKKNSRTDTNGGTDTNSHAGNTATAAAARPDAPGRSDVPDSTTAASLGAAST